MNKDEHRKFEFLSFDSNNEKHQEFLKTILEDIKVKEYIKSIESYIKRDSEEPLNKAYLVGLNDEIVGYLNLIDYGRIIEMDCAISPTFRGKRNNLGETIGCQIARETAEYIFESYNSVNYLRLMIASSNERSIKAAKRAGATFFRHYSEGDEYRIYPKGKVR